jgi:hypothetical protein
MVTLSVIGFVCVSNLLFSKTPLLYKFSSAQTLFEIFSLILPIIDAQSKTPGHGILPAVRVSIYIGIAVTLSLKRKRITASC